jgi:hypothetical protein
MSGVQTDPLPLLRIWHARCRRHDQSPPANDDTAATLSVTIGELTRLRAANEKLRNERSLLEAVVTGRPRGLT